MNHLFGYLYSTDKHENSILLNGILEATIHNSDGIDLAKDTPKLEILDGREDDDYVSCEQNLNNGLKQKPIYGELNLNDIDFASNFVKVDFDQELHKCEFSSIDDSVYLQQVENDGFLNIVNKNANLGAINDFDIPEFGSTSECGSVQNNTNLNKECADSINLITCSEGSENNSEYDIVNKDYEMENILFENDSEFDILNQNAINLSEYGTQNSNIKSGCINDESCRSEPTLECNANNQYVECEYAQHEKRKVEIMNGIDKIPIVSVQEINPIVYVQEKIPIVYVQDILNKDNIVKSCLTEISKYDRTVIFADVNPLGSVYDRAIQLFHEIKGEICYFGKSNNREPSGPGGQINDVDKTCTVYGKYPQWSDEHPLHFVCLGYGGNTVRELLYLLMSGQIPKFDNTSKYNSASYYVTNEKYIASIVTICSPLGGINWISRDSNFYINKGLVPNSIALKYIGWSLIFSRKSNSLQEYLSTKKMQYWNLPYNICLFLCENKLQEYLSGNVCFKDLNTTDCMIKYRFRYESVLRYASVPVLKVVADSSTCESDSHDYDDHCVSNKSQRYFYASNPNEKKYKNPSQFKCSEYEDAYILLDSEISCNDVIESPIFDDTYLDKTFQINKILYEIFESLSA